MTNKAEHFFMFTGHLDSSSAKFLLKSCLLVIELALFIDLVFLRQGLTVQLRPALSSLCNLRASASQELGWWACATTPCPADFM